MSLTVWVQIPALHKSLDLFALVLSSVKQDKQRCLPPRPDCADVMNRLGQRAMAEDSWGLSPLGHSEHVSGARGRWREEVRTIWRSGKIL